MGMGRANNSRGYIWGNHMTELGAKESGARAFAMAGITPQDIDTAQIYDSLASRAFGASVKSTSISRTVRHRICEMSWNASATKAPLPSTTAMVRMKPGSRL